MSSFVLILECSFCLSAEYVNGGSLDDCCDEKPVYCCHEKGMSLAQNRGQKRPFEPGFKIGRKI